MASTATWSIRTVVKDDTKSGLSRLKSTLATEMANVEKVMSDPFSAATREVNVLIGMVDKLARSASAAKIFPDKSLNDLDAIETKLKNINSAIGSLNSTGASALSANIALALHAVNVTRDVGVRSPNSRYGISDTGESFNIPTWHPSTTEQKIQSIRIQQLLAGGPIIRPEMQRQASLASRSSNDLYSQMWMNAERERTASIISFEREASLTRPGFTREDPRIRQQRIDRKLSMLDGSYASNLERQLVERDEAQTASTRLREAGARLDLYGKANYIDPARGRLAPSIGMYREQDEARTLNATDAPLKTTIPYGPFTPQYILKQREEEADWVKHLSLKQERGDSAYSANINKGDFRNLDGSLRLQNLKNITAEYKKQESAVESFIRRFSQLDAKQLEAEQRRVQIAKQAGLNVDARAEALNITQNPFHPRNARTGRGSDHALRYGAQNAAFALEDFLISSQYGGPAAGFRAITNNMTAIAAAAGATMTPLGAAALIGGVAVGGVGLGYAADNMSQSKKSGMELWYETLHKHRDSKTEQFERFTESKADAINRVKPTDYNSNLALWEATYTDQHRRETEIARSSSRLEDARIDYNFKIRNSHFFNRKPSEEAMNKYLEEKATYESLIAEHRFVQGNQEQLYARTQKSNERDIRISNKEADHKLAVMQNPERQYELDKEMLEFRYNEQRKTATNEFEQSRLKAQFDTDMRVLTGTRDIARKKSKENLDSEDALYQDTLSERTRIHEYQGRVAEGELLDPFRLFTEEKDIRRKHREHELKKAKTKEEKELIGQKYDQADLDSWLKYEFVDNPIYSKSIRNRQFEHRSALNSAELDPSKRINTEFDIEADRLKDNKYWTDEQRDQQLAALEKRRKHALDQATQMPALGMAVDVGSVADLSLRQKYFDRSHTSDDAAVKSEQHLATLVEKIRLLTEAVKENKVPIKSLNSRM